MKKFIQSNKKILFVFLFFVFLASASGIYLKIGLINNRNPKTAAIGNQDSPPEQTQTQISPDSQKPAIENKEPGDSALTKNTTKNISQTPEAVQKHILYVGEKKYEIAVPENSTVYDLMNSLKQRGDIGFKGQTSTGLGFFVEEINGIKNSANNNTYWIYYINGKTAGVGISNYILKPNDIISWKYEKPQF